jgi:hypothetical protein
VDEGGDVGNLIVGERELRHPRTPGAHDRRHQFAVLIVEHDARAQEAGPAVTPARVGAVAKLTVDAVERLAAFDRRGISRRAVRVVAALRADTKRRHHDQRRDR